MLKQLKMKLLISLVAVLLAIAVLASVTYAWFSVSTTPEISAVSFNISIYRALQVSLSGADDSWTDNITLEASFNDDDLVKILQPVSTLDGVNWFACTYSGSNLNELSLFDHSDTLAWGNVRYTASFTDASGTDITDATEKRNAAESQSHFVYTDFWLRTEDPDGCKVRLSVPSVSTTDAELNGHYGTYVLPKYVASDTEIICESNGSETAVRVGFLIYGDGPDASPTDFYIYEPNADKRSSAADKETAGEYVIGYNYSSSTYSSDYYLKTHPIGWLPTLVQYDMPALYVVNGNTMVSYSGALSTDTNYYVLGTDYVSATDTPTYWANDHAYVLFQPPELYASNAASLSNKPVTPTDTDVTYYYSTGYSAQLADIEPDHLIVQKAGEWDLDKVKEKLSNNTPLDSTAVASFGSFINTEEIDAAGDSVALDTLSDDIAGNAILLTLKANTPVKIRLIVWVEGQDPDCWNDIHTGSFTINVEFAGETRY